MGVLHHASIEHLKHVKEENPKTELLLICAGTRSLALAPVTNFSPLAKSSSVCSPVCMCVPCLNP